MWLDEFRKLFPEATKRYAGRRQNLEEVEQKLVRARTEMRVDSGELRVIEESTEEWTYAQWWPRLSNTLGEGEHIELPRDLNHVQAKQRAVQLLYDRIKHIEVVSVILRFLWPEHFGIISPPVVSILNLIPTGRENHPSHYLRYLQTLDVLRKRYGGLEKVADVDMALWSAAHFAREINHPYESLVKQMYRDEYFQELRLRNLLIGVRKHWRQKD